MCERPVTSSSVGDDADRKVGAGGKGGGDAVKKSTVVKREETELEKCARRKQERRRRTLLKRQAAGKLVTGQAIPKKVKLQFNQVWDRENAFVAQVMQCLPEVYNPGQAVEEDEKDEEYLVQGDDAQDEVTEKAKTEKFYAKVRKTLASQGLQPTERATSYLELRERLHRKIAELAQKPNKVKREKKVQKKLKRAQEAKENSNKGKKLISQSASAASTSNSGTEDSRTIKSESTSEKTPLTKKPVVKSNGEIVYSKFDFISNGNSRISGNSSVDKMTSKKKKDGVKQTSEDLLKKAEKHEKQISKLATQGKQSAAVDLAETQKWDTALKRAEGHKVRDDPYLLKKSIKKQEKLKQLTKKKWKDRVERVEKQKELRQQKRNTNIQSRKDDNKKRVKKLLRKRGRIA